MQRLGDEIVSNEQVLLYNATLQSITVKAAPATVVLYDYSGVQTVKLPFARSNAGRYIFVQADIATSTNYVSVIPASGDRIYSGTSVVTSVTLDAYSEDVLLFSDGLFWYVCEAVAT